MVIKLKCEIDVITFILLILFLSFSFSLNIFAKDINAGESLFIQQKVIISEISASNSKLLTDEDNESSDWIEIFNAGQETVQLLDWSLTDDSLNVRKWLFPDIEIGAGEFIVVFASSKNRRIQGAELHTNFKLNKDGEYLALSNNTGNIISEYRPDYGTQYEDISYGVLYKKDTTELVHSASLGKLYLPSETAWKNIKNSWYGNNETFDDSQWKVVKQSIGFDFRNSSNSDVNIALGKPAIESSSYSPGYYPTSGGNDGNYTSGSHTNYNDYNPWWEVNLQKTFNLDRIAIYNRFDCCQIRLYNISIEVFDSKGNSVYESPVLNACAEGEVPVSPGDKIEFSFTSESGRIVSGQTIRIKKTSVSGGEEFLTLAEVEIFEFETYHHKIQTDLSEMKDSTTLALIRYPFQVDNLSEIDLLQLKMSFDDGFIAYLNGEEVVSINKPEENTDSIIAASGIHMAVQSELFSIPVNALKDGGNILAIAGLNYKKDDPSFYLKPELLALSIDSVGQGYFLSPTPGALNVNGVRGFVADTKFNIDRGFFNEAFTVTISCETPGAFIVYTTDGSEPSIENGIVVEAQNEQVEGLAMVEISTTTVLRATAFKEGLQSTNTDTHTYIFIDDVIASSVMNKSITESSRYKPYMKESLSLLPTISLVTNQGTINTDDHQKASIEWLLPNAEDVFQENCGVKYYGGTFTNFTKKNFRLYFKSEYGASKLEHPLFNGFDHGLPAVEKFDQLELRAGSHDMVERGFYMSNRFTDDTMLDMGNLNTHGRFVHLYLNGVYWGLYHLRERWSADMVAQYKGGEKEDYEAINGNYNVGGWDIDDKPYDGDGSYWAEAKSLREDYEAIKEIVDFNSFIDFMLMYMYGNSENEYRTIGSKSQGVKFQFQLNDADGFLRNSENRTSMKQPGQDHADGPNSIFSMLMKEGHPAFKILVADRIHKHFFHNGALTPNSITERLEKRCDEIETPFYAEAARWGFRTPESWEYAKNSYISNVVPYRTYTVIQQFKDAGFYPDLSAPWFYVNNVEQYGGAFKNGDELSMFKSQREIYYSLNGTDPYVPVKLINELIIDENAYKSALVLKSAIPENWNVTGFDDSDWKHGSNAVGYEMGNGNQNEIGIDVSSMYNSSTGCLVRIPFELTDVVSLETKKLLLKMKYDDGFIAYINGYEIKRANFSDEPAWGAKADFSIEASAFIEYDITSHVDKLQNGQNILAIHGLNISTLSSDFLISARLEAKDELNLETQLSQDAIQYSAPITLDSTIVIKARAYKDGIWSALSEAVFYNDLANGYEQLKIAENKSVKSFPNPFNNQLTIEFESLTDAKVELEVFNIFGWKVWHESSTKMAGEKIVFPINTSNWNDGIYIYRITTNNGEIYSGKMICNKSK